MYICASYTPGIEMPELELFWNIAIQCYILNSNAHWNLEFCTSMPDLPPQPPAVCCITHTNRTSVKWLEWLVLV